MLQYVIDGGNAGWVPAVDRTKLPSLGQNWAMELAGFGNVMPVCLTANDGHPVMAYVAMPDRHKEGWRNLKRNCHGLTFANGAFLINNAEVLTILKHDSYRKVEDTKDIKIDDVVVYWKKDRKGDSEAVHSARVTEIDDKGNITVKGKNGAGTVEQSGVADGYHDYDAIEYYHPPETDGGKGSGSADRNSRNQRAPEDGKKENEK